MILNTDTFLQIGTSHKVCEDYVLHGEAEGGRKFLIVSDGCSSSDNTEMGARILCHLAKKFLLERFAGGLQSLKDMPDQDVMASDIIYGAKLASGMLGLDLDCLDATLVVGIFEPVNQEFHIYIYGDADILMETKDNTIKIINIEYTSQIQKYSNAPYYLSYRLDEYRDDLYHRMKVDKIITTRTCELKDFPEGWHDPCTVAYDYVQPMIFSADELKSILICSDGFSSFVEPGENGMVKSNPFIIAANFLSFKNWRGEFLKRRMNRALKELEQTHTTHYDDLSIAAISFLEE